MTCSPMPLQEEDRASWHAHHWYLPIQVQIYLSKPGRSYATSMRSISGVVLRGWVCSG